MRVHAFGLRMDAYTRTRSFATRNVRVMNCCRTTFIGKLNEGDKFCFPKDYSKRIVSVIRSKRGYITTYMRNGILKKSFRYYQEVIAL